MVRAHEKGRERLDMYMARYWVEIDMPQRQVVLEGEWHVSTQERESGGAPHG